MPGKTATPRRLVSRFRLRHAMAAGLFSSTDPRHPVPQVTPFAPVGDGGPANGTAPQSEEIDHQAIRSWVAHLDEAARLSLPHPLRALRPGHVRTLGPLAGSSRRRPRERPSPYQPLDPAADPNPARVALPRREGSATFTASPESHKDDFKPPTHRPVTPEEPPSVEQNRRSPKVSAVPGGLDTTVACKPKPETPPRPDPPDALACEPNVSNISIGSNRKHRLDLNFLCIRPLQSHRCSRNSPQTSPQVPGSAQVLPVVATRSCGDSRCADQAAADARTVPRQSLATGGRR